VRRSLALLPGVLAVVAACGGSGGSPAVTPSQGPSAAPSAGALTPLTVGLGFIPSVQFAQFYLADEAGYYRDAGLDVTLENKIDPDLITLIGQGAVDIGLGDGTSVIPAVSQDIPVRYAATVYARFPGVVFAKTSSGIAGPADLEGRRLGTPGRYGSSWVMLQALLASAGLTPDDLTIELFPDFSQAGALQQDRVDAATGFANNEPVQLERSGIDVSVITVDDITPLPGPGLVTSPATIAEKGESLTAFVAATLRAMEEIAADPEVGLDAAIARVPELADDRDGQLAVLEATIEQWSGPYQEEHGIGSIDPDAWTESVEFMRGLPDTVVARPVTVDELITEELLDGER
jgi:NitT/TauT family transport system substrate-binding protein